MRIAVHCVDVSAGYTGVVNGTAAAQSCDKNYVLLQTNHEYTANKQCSASGPTKVSQGECTTSRLLLPGLLSAGGAGGAGAV